MPERRASSIRTSEEDLSQTDVELRDNPLRRHKRIASVYDAVAGRIGFNGFLSQGQLEAGVTALKPEEVLLRRVDAPSGVSREYYNADESLKPNQTLPDAEVVKAVHKYASDYYSAHAHGAVNRNYKSLDETALMAFAILMEEATAEALGETADMVLVEPEGLEDELPESAMTKHQVRGRVKPPPTPDPASSEEASSSEDHLSGDVSSSRSMSTSMSANMSMSSTSDVLTSETSRTDAEQDEPLSPEPTSSFQPPGITFAIINWAFCSTPSLLLHSTQVKHLQKVLRSSPPSNLMAPKGVSQAEKLEKILRYFRQSGTCHTLKDLESALPSAASVHKMQVKDLIKELTDENKVNVEKIGSGNWYWCWAGEEARDKKNMVAQLEAEKSKIEESSAALNDRAGKLRETRRDAQANTAHQEYLKQLGPLEDEVKRLTAEKDSWENAVAGGVEGLKADIAKSREETSLLADNIETIESQLHSLLNGDTASMDQIRRYCYGALYVDGEGLPEIEGL